MKRKVILSLLVILVIMLSGSIILSAQDDDIVEDSAWVVVYTNNQLVHIRNNSSEYLMIKFDSFAERTLGGDKFFHDTVIKPNEDLVMPRCTTIYIKVDGRKVEKADLRTVVISD
jgi:hypothetical protein